MLDRDRETRFMRKGSLARFEIYVGGAVIVLALLVAGYGLVQALADRIDPKVRDCVDRTLANAVKVGRPVTHDYAVTLCKRLESIGAL